MKRQRCGSVLVCNLVNRNGQWLVCGPICKDLRKKWFECANLKTLKMREELSASFVFCKKALSHRCLCLTLTSKYRRMIKLLHGEGGEGHDCRSRGTDASKEEVDTTNDDRAQHCVQFWSGIQCNDQLGNSSTQRSCDTTITSVLSDNSSSGKCTDDGRGFVKTLSGTPGTETSAKRIAGQCGSFKTNSNGAGCGDR